MKLKRSSRALLAIDGGGHRDGGLHSGELRGGGLRGGGLQEHLGGGQLTNSGEGTCGEGVSGEGACTPPAAFAAAAAASAKRAFTPCACLQLIVNGGGTRTHLDTLIAEGKALAGCWILLLCLQEAMERMVCAHAPRLVQSGRDLEWCTTEPVDERSADGHRHRQTVAVTYAVRCAVTGRVIPQHAENGHDTVTEQLAVRLWCCYFAVTNTA